MQTEEVVITKDFGFTPATMLNAGELTAMYESGRLRYIKTVNEEIVRMIYPALRDENWNTVPARVTGETIENKPGSFVINYQAEYDQGSIQYVARYTLHGQEDGTILFRMQGEALSDFRSRRLGLCVHHPVTSCAGRPVQIKGTGKVVHARYPTLISPHQPFTGIEAMSWTTIRNCRVELRFGGDTFETEDQRNWTDDSFKTYSGPLDAVPMLQIRKGDTMEQTVTLIVAADRADVVVPAELHEPAETKVPFPLIGYQRGYDPPALTPATIALLKTIPFDHYRVDVHLHDTSWKNVLRTAIREAFDLETGIELVVFFHLLAASGVDELLKMITDSGKIIRSVLILSDDADVMPTELFTYVHDRFRAALPYLRVGYGTDGNFAELNRGLPAPIPYDFVSFPVHPQVHFSDSRSILENLGSQHTTVDTLRQSIGPRNIHVSPITIQPRHRFPAPVPTGFAANDPRQHTGLTAWWMVNAFVNFSGAGHLTFFELVGERGIIRVQGQPPSPVFKILQKIRAFSPAFLARSNDGRICFENTTGDRMCFRADFYKEQLV